MLPAPCTCQCKHRQACFAIVHALPSPLTHTPQSHACTLRTFSTIFSSAQMNNLPRSELLGHELMLQFH